MFGIDALESSHPISIPVKHPDEINEIFDRISYGKGASIIRMMEKFITAKTFRFLSLVLFLTLFNSGGVYACVYAYTHANFL